ncbi:MAG: nucleotidyl transferase AbiEii/AbiGii toxin family protein [Candidatus Cloacimonetes bacterium]|nr:nucleotidyl transferase AbiEii/AbiGii toxin family protein [Candidatus Cloacimonadota bacterium]MDD2423232.1 nucleotidyl transferase AbiEii/AbiGii toxin family protein [Candidatus Cloacimonadota bacterium]
MIKNQALTALIESHSPKTKAEYKQALLVAMQEICLLGLWRSGFFEHAAFYGGTALSLFHGLDRFSEDLDFSLLKPLPEFSLSAFLAGVRQELGAWGIDADLAMVQKTSGSIQTANIKANTLSVMESISLPVHILKSFHRDEISHVKFELDPNPPCNFATEMKFLLSPIPFSVRIMSPPDLYAGKMHALLVRNWQNRVKGRDWYDFIWFVKHEIALNLSHLEARLKQSGHLDLDATLTIAQFSKLMQKRIRTVDYEQAKQDVLPFIMDPRQLENWSKELFAQLAEAITLQE